MAEDILSTNYHLYPEAQAHKENPHTYNTDESMSLKGDLKKQASFVKRFQNALISTNTLFFILFAALVALATPYFNPDATEALSNTENGLLSTTSAALALGAMVAALGFVGGILGKTKESRQTSLDVASVVLVVLFFWQLFSAVIPLLPTKMFPVPGLVVTQIIADSSKIGEGIVSSLGIIAEGFILGSVSALIIGLVLGSAGRSFRAAEKIVSFLSAIPPIVYIPYGIALLPTFRASSILVIFLATFWPTLTGTLAGVSHVDNRLLNSARVLNVNRFKMLFRVTLPASLPLIFNGLNIGLCLSFILLTSAEMIGGSTGMGYYVKYYSDFSDYTRILAGIIVIGVVITLVSTLFNKLQRYLLRWQ